MKPLGIRPTSRSIKLLEPGGTQAGKQHSHMSSHPAAYSTSTSLQRDKSKEAAVGASKIESLHSH